jgi:hypothetical protein
VQVVGEEAVEEQEEPAPSRAQRLQERRANRSWERHDTTLVVVAAVATVFVHPVHAMLSHPYWLDEAWVAALTKAPFSRLTDLSASAPAGFIALLKLVPGSGLQRARVVPLGFAVLSVVMAYVFARSLNWGRRGDARFGAIVAALVVMLAPLALRRNDLKQYTCDAFCALVLLTIGAWAEREPRRSRFLCLAGAAVVAIPFSSTSAFVSVAMFAGLLGSALIARNLRRATEIVAAGAVAAVGLGAYMGLVVLPTLNPRLKAYWATQYLDGSPLHVFTATWKRLARFTTELSMPLPMFIVLFLIGIAIFVKLRAPALAIAVPFLWIEMALMGRLHRYPYLDLRTSHFLFVVSLVVVAVGAAGMLQLIAAHTRGTFPAGPRPAIAVGVGAVLAVLFTLSFAREIDRLSIPNENVRAEVEAVAKTRTDRDVVLVNSSAAFGFGYYWPNGSIDFRSDTSGQGFRPEVRGVDAVYVRGRTYFDVRDGLRAAVARWRGVSGSRLFIVRTHLNGSEAAAWRRALDELGLQPRSIAVGFDPLLVVKG